MKHRTFIRVPPTTSADLCKISGDARKGWEQRCEEIRKATLRRVRGGGGRGTVGTENTYSTGENES